MQALAPTGKLRAALYLGGPTNVVEGPSGEMKGVGYELGRELARRMGIPYEPVIYQTPKLLVEDINSGKWDISFIAQDADREKILDFTGVYLRLEHGYLVPNGSTIQTISEVDRPGIRVGVPAGGSVIPPLKRTLKDAQIVEVAMPDAADLVKSGKVDVFAANKANLFAIAEKLPGSRVLEGRFSVDSFALGLPKGRQAGLAYARKFIEDAKAEGLVKSAAEKAGVRGAVQECSWHSAIWLRLLTRSKRSWGGHRQRTDSDPERKSGRQNCRDAQHDFFNNVVGCHPRPEGST
jgi:polar amino acid transport system substrate-binding protein